jgi:hypothetical protein
MGERDSNEKDKVEKLRVPVSFNTQSSDDGFLKVDIPGKFYRFGEEGVLDQLQYADMANGSYYMVTRIKTNSQFWGHNEEVVRKKIDSLLYENVPGKILNRQEILRNGYRGLDILNRTRRGDVQRYNIFVTPFEVIIFKMSGNGDYVQNGDESKRFFGSIHLKEYKTDVIAGWHQFQPASGGFIVDLPHEPFVSKNNSSLGGQGIWEYEADDKGSGTNYTILRTDIHNYGFAEEDTFDLALLDESFGGSAFIDKQLTRKLITWKGYPALDCKYLHKDGSLLTVRFIIQGPHYYTLVAHGRQENNVTQNFFNSFEIRPFVYQFPFEKKDTSLEYSVKTTFYPEDKKIKLAIPGEDNSVENADDDDDNTVNGNFKNNIIKNDTTGETIYLSFYRTSKYYYNDDSSDIDENRVTREGSWIIRNKKKINDANGWRVVELQLSDTNSSRLVWTKTFYRNGIGFFLATESDTLTTASSFLKNFFETFTPSDDLKGFNPFEKKSVVFFNDFFNSDSQVHKQAIKAIDQVKVDSTDFADLKKAISTVSWKEKKYLEIKKSLINKLGDIKTRASSDLLRDLYYAAGDTIDMQYVALESLLQQQTQYAFAVFKTIISVEPPVIEGGYNSSSAIFNQGSYRFNIRSRYVGNNNYDNGDFWDELYDSVQLTRTILPEILPLVNLDDYKWKTMRLLGRMIDSDLVRSQDYEIYYSKFFIEAKQELRKQSINEKRKLIKKAASKNLKEGEDDDDDKNDDYGNEKLGLYAKLLLPFWEKNVNVPDLFQQIMKSDDKKLKYAIMLMLIRNNKPVADSTLNYFAVMDDYRYTLYRDLKKMDRLKFFPAKYDNKADLAKSKLIDSKTYGGPDSVVFLDKLPVKFRSEQGLCLFF